MPVEPSKEYPGVRAIKHPLSGAIYDLMADGSIRVQARSGDVGFFDTDGRWASGELKQADPHLCVWIGGRELENRFQQAAGALNESAS